MREQMLERMRTRSKQTNAAPAPPTSRHTYSSGPPDATELWSPLDEAREIASERRLRIEPIGSKLAIIHEISGEVLVPDVGRMELLDAISLATGRYFRR